MKIDFEVADNITVHLTENASELLENIGELVIVSVSWKRTINVPIINVPPERVKPVCKHVSW